MKQKRNKGITLIALVITIIVLLILATVSIATLTGENGLFGKATLADERTKEEGAKEKVSIAAQAAMEEDEATGEYSLNLEKFEKEITDFGGSILDVTESEILVEMDGYEIAVDYHGRILYSNKLGEKIISAVINAKQYQADGTEIVADQVYGEIYLTVKVDNKDEILQNEGTIEEITVLDSKGEQLTEEETVVSDGEKTYKILYNGKYTVKVKTRVNGRNKTEQQEVLVTQIVVPEFSRLNPIIDIRFISDTSNETVEGTPANAPKLGNNMVPVNYIDGTWKEVSESEWQYSYEEGISNWANAAVKNGSGEITGYFVWIPRYAYKITYYDESDTSRQGNPIGYSDSRGIVRQDGRICTGANSARRDAGDNYIVHPAFTDDVNVGGWGTEIKGIWVAKYEASESSGELRILPSVQNWRGSNTMDDMYTISENYSKDNGSHLIKNSEWGAVAYLSYSKYGLGPDTPVGKNPYHVTGSGSTTGNSYGIYDMCGGGSEYLSGYFNNGNDALKKYAKSFATQNKKEASSNNMVTVYKASNSDTSSTTDKDDATKNYALMGETMFGDALFETSINGDALQNGYASIPSGARPFFCRGGYIGDSDANIFSYTIGMGYVYADSNTFRPALAF